MGERDRGVDQTMRERERERERERDFKMYKYVQRERLSIN